MTNPPGSGLGAFVGSGIETAGSYGTLATINKWTAFESFDIKPNQTWVEGAGLHGGQVTRFDSEAVLTKQDASGSAKLNFYYNGMGRLLGSLMGGLTTAPVQQGATTAYSLTLTGPSPDWQQSLSFQQLIPDITQAGHYWNVLGAKVTDAQFECADGGALVATFNIDAQDVYEAATGTAPTAGQPAGQPYFAWHQSAVKIGTYGSEVKVDGVKKWTASIKKGLDTGRFNMGNITTNPNLTYAVKDEPAYGTWADIGGTLETEYLNDTLFENYYTTNTPFSMVTSFTSATMAGTAYPYSVTFAFPRCRFVGAEYPTIKGPQIVQPSMPFKVYNDGTHPACTITIVSQDMTI